MIKVLIADDHPVVRMGTKHILEKADDIIVVDEAENGAEALKKASESGIDVVLLDISMPGRDGLDVLKQLKQDMPDLPVLVLSMYPEKQYAIRVLKTGAAGYLTKKSAPYDLINAIRKVSRGGKYVSPSLAEQLAFYLEDGTEKPLHETLSNREHQVMRLICAGKSTTEIADELCVSVQAISTYRARILEKMNMESTAELIVYAVKNHLID
jgi:DNA-binding NarL/FixJ family response regulator